MASTDAKPVPQKNVAYRITFPILDADGDLVTGASGLDSEISKDAGTFADCTNEATEIATSSGVYYLDLTSTEMNADTVAIIVKTSTSGAKTTVLVMYPEEAGDIRVNATQLNGTSLTGRDIGASVLLSSGTGTGQLDFTSGVVKANVTQFGGTNATATGGRPEVNTSHIAGSAVSTSSAQIGVNVVNAAGTAWNSGAIGASTLATDTITAAKIAADAIGASELGADAATEIGTAVWATTTRLLTAGTNIALAKGTGITGFNDLDAAGVRSAVGLASANLDTQLTTIDDFLDTEIAAIKAKTDNLPTDPADASDIASAFSTVNTKLDAVKAKTDSLTFTTAGQVDANIQYVNDVQVAGDGDGTPWGPV